jgi:hypothetical protein
MQVLGFQPLTLSPGFCFSGHHEQVEICFCFHNADVLWFDAIRHYPTRDEYCTALSRNYTMRFKTQWLRPPSVRSLLVQCTEMS